MDQKFRKTTLLKGKIPGEETGIQVKKTVCAICSANCGIDAYIKDGNVIKVEGSMENPVSHGTLCSKGSSNRQYIYHADRVTTPLIKKRGKDSDKFDPISWDDALDIISSRLLKIKKEFGPESVVFFTGFPKRLRPFLQRLATGYGSPNYCTESSACYFATAIANILNYGQVGYPDIPKSKCILLWSTNPFYSSTPGVKDLLNAIENGLKVIEVGPLTTPMTARADIHLRIRPGTSGALALGMANVIIKEGLFDLEFINRWTIGFDEYREYAKEFTPQVTERITGVTANRIIKAARLYASSKPSSIVSGASPTVHHTNAVQNHRAITALIGLTGNFDREGGNYVVPTSYYHQPTGLVTREHEFEQFRSFDEMAPRIGLDKHPVWCKIVDEAQAMHIPFQIQSGEPYPIKALVGFGMNYRMWPGSDFMKSSLKKLDFMVDVDLFMTDTARLADLVLPACSSFEKDDLRLWPSRYAIWTQPVIAPVGKARPDIDIIIDLAKRLNPDDSLMAQGQEACLDWIFEPSGFKISDIRHQLEGCFLKGKTMPPYEKYIENGFPTPSGKMEFTSNILREAGFDPLPRYAEPKLSPISTPDIAKNYPFILTTGARLPMFFHSRTFKLSWMRRLRREPMADINPRDAAKRDIRQDDGINLSTPRSSIRVKANITEKVPPGVVNMYHGYPEADVNQLIKPDYRDPISGYPGFKSLLCNIEKTKSHSVS